MRTIKLVLQYDGTGFHGFQRQKASENVRTVQGEIDRALGELTGVVVETHGASRTDAGVHALGQVVSFETDCGIPGDRFAAAVRRFLPEDLQTVGSWEMEDGFHARFSNCGKEYMYLAYGGVAENPVLRRRALLVRGRFDMDRASRAFEAFEGTHDFSALRNVGSGPANPVKTIHVASVREENGFYVFRVRGSGFLYKMVRNMVGTAIGAARGEIEPEDVPRIIAGGSRAEAGKTLPPHGLYLVKVLYAGDVC